MAYFANGVEGDLFEEQNCRMCVHEKSVQFHKDEPYWYPPACPIVELHRLWNYDQHDKGEAGQIKKAALSILIPDPGPGIIPTCPMLVRKETP